MAEEGTRPERSVKSSWGRQQCGSKGDGWHLTRKAVAQALIGWLVVAGKRKLEFDSSPSRVSNSGKGNTYTHTYTHKNRERDGESWERPHKLGQDGEVRNGWQMQRDASATPNKHAQGVWVVVRNKGGGKKGTSSMSPIMAGAEC